MCAASPSCPWSPSELGSPPVPEPSRARPATPSARRKPERAGPLCTQTTDQAWVCEALEGHTHVGTRHTWHPPPMLPREGPPATTRPRQGSRDVTLVSPRPGSQASWAEPRGLVSTPTAAFLCTEGLKVRGEGRCSRPSPCVSYTQRAGRRHRPFVGHREAPPGKLPLWSSPCWPPAPQEAALE